MRPPRLTIRALMLAIVLISLNLAAVIIASKYYPRPSLPQAVLLGDGRGYVCYRADGTIAYGVGNAETGYRLIHVDRVPSRPTLIRIWSPVIGSVSITLIALALALSGLKMPRMTRRSQALAVLASALMIWVATPVARIVGDPEADYHVHYGVPREGTFITLMHTNPLWPRYWRLLLGRPWPGDYICPDFSGTVRGVHSVSRPFSYGRLANAPSIA